MDAFGDEGGQHRRAVFSGDQVFAMRVGQMVLIAKILVVLCELRGQRLRRPPDSYASMASARLRRNPPPRSACCMLMNIDTPTKATSESSRVPKHQSRIL